MAVRKYTTVSVHRETYEAGKRFMEEHGYPSWEALIRGTISGHRVQRDGVIEIDLVPLVRKQTESNQGTKKDESPRPSVDVKQTPVRVRDDLRSARVRSYAMSAWRSTWSSGIQPIRPMSTRRGKCSPAQAGPAIVARCGYCGSE